ncbi:MAG: hypothetical protein VX871_03310 [Pseudomonadota bacterium]|nr:hypothetical protein [Pseudomonadota bacterium]
MIQFFPASVRVAAVATVLLLCIQSPPARAAGCGGVNQPSCKASESPRSCQGGLVSQGGRCVQRQIHIPLNACGGRNQPPCALQPSRDACASGYAVNLATGRCERLRKCAPDDLDCRYLN